MSVLSTFTLPAQPAAGQAFYTPLGGDGWVAPQSLWYVDLESTGDSGGGIHQLTINEDLRFSQIVSFLMLQTDGGAVTAEFRVFAETTARAAHVGPTIAAASDSFLTWSPPLILNAEAWRVTAPNVDGEVLNLKAMIFNYRKRAAEEVPLDKLLASFPRASTAI